MNHTDLHSTVHDAFIYHSVDATLNVCEQLSMATKS